MNDFGTKQGPSSGGIPQLNSTNPRQASQEAWCFDESRLPSRCRNPSTSRHDGSIGGGDRSTTGDTPPPSLLRLFLKFTRDKFMANIFPFRHATCYFVGKLLSRTVCRHPSILCRLSTSQTCALCTGLPVLCTLSTVHNRAGKSTS